MKAACRLLLLSASFGSVFLAGCSLFPTTRKLPQPKAPNITQTLSPEELVDRLEHRWDNLNTLIAKVEFHASVNKTKEGVATDYPSVEGHILMRKPAVVARARPDDRHQSLRHGK